MWLAILGMASSCASMSDREQCMLIGASAGAFTGGLVATGTVAVHGRSDQYPWAVPAGVVGGAVIGGLAGYDLGCACAQHVDTSVRNWCATFGIDHDASDAIARGRLAVKRRCSEDEPDEPVDARNHCSSFEISMVVTPLSSIWTLTPPESDLMNVGLRYSTS